MRWLHRYAILTACATLPLLTVGGAVTSTNAGLAVPDWPLSYGTLFPERWTEIATVFVEHLHRLVGATVGMLVIGLAVWTHRVERRKWVRVFGWLMLAAVIVQGVMGGLRVNLISTELAVVHACTAQLFFCMTVAMALFTSRFWIEERRVESAATLLRTAWIVTAAVVFGQLVAGAVLRHTAAGVLVHVLGAVVVTLVIGVSVMWTLSSVTGHRALGRLSMTVAALVVTQLFLGAAAFFIVAAMDERMSPTRLQVFVPTAHVLVGALILASCVSLALATARLSPAASRDPAAMPAGLEAS